MNCNDERYFSGELVVVRNAAEILQTLDSNGTLDGLPFMPEMADYCNKRFRVSRRVEKTCVEISVGNYDIREFIQDDVVFLEGLRCSGAFHGGCQRICKLFWKGAWLRNAGDSQPFDPVGVEGKSKLLSRLKTVADNGRYYCQSTELANVTRSMSRVKRLMKCFDVVLKGDVGVLKMLNLVLVPLWRKGTRRIRSSVVGNMSRTPVARLDLQPGEMVEVKSVDEIVQTLDPKGRNRGLQYDLLLGKYSGRRFRVQSRLDFMIMEPTGEMKRPEATVILENLTCFCADVVGGCPREDVIYWREIWLNRVGSSTDGIDEIADAN
jgi:hypothetical protein